MLKRGKLVLSIACLCVCFASMIFGVFAMTQINFSAGAEISFFAYDLSASVFGTVTNAINFDGSTFVSNLGTISNPVDVFEVSESGWNVGEFYLNDLTEEQTPKAIISVGIYNNSQFPISVFAVVNSNKVDNKNLSDYCDITINDLDYLTPSTGSGEYGVVEIVFQVKSIENLEANGIQNSNFSFSDLDISISLNRVRER